MNDFAIHIASIIAASVVIGAAITYAIASVLISHRHTHTHTRGTVSEMQIEVTADTRAATDAIKKVCAEIAAAHEAAQQLDDLLAGRSVQALDKLTLAKGDTLVVMSESMLASQQRAQIAAYVKPKLPEGVEVLVLDGGLTLAQLSRTRAAAEV
jgi:hypothetical protein